MDNVGSISVSYDRPGDVLYLTLRREQAARGIEDEKGIVWRYAGDGSLLSVMVLDFLDRWAQDMDTLAGQIASKAHIPLSQIEAAIHAARAQAA